MSPRSLSVTVWCMVIGWSTLVAASSRDAAEPVERQGDWVVQGQELRRAQHIRLNGNLVLPAGAELTLEDCTLEIVGGYSREHLVDWQGGRLITRRCTLGGYVHPDGTPVHTVFHLYDGQWQAEDTVIQYSYGVSFHWEKGRGVLRGTRLKAGPRPDAIILSGEADVRLVDSSFPIGLGIYVDQGGKTRVDLETNRPVTVTYDAAALTPGVRWRLELVNTAVERWFVFVRNIGMAHPPCEITLGASHDLIVSLLGHNLVGQLVLSRDLQVPMRVGNVTLKNAGQPADISMWAIYLSGDETDLDVGGNGHICELMQRGGHLQVHATPGKNELSIGCTTLELSGSAVMEVQNVHFGRPLTWQDDAELGEATVAGSARLIGGDMSVRNVRFHTREHGQVELTNVVERGKVERRVEGGPVRIGRARTAAEEQ